MSETRRMAAPRGPHGHGPMGMGGEKAKDFSRQYQENTPIYE